MVQVAYPLDLMWSEGKIIDPGLKDVVKVVTELEAKMQATFPITGQYETLTAAWELARPDDAATEDPEIRIILKFFYLIWQKIWYGNHWVS